SSSPPGWAERRGCTPASRQPRRKPDSPPSRGTEKTGQQKSECCLSCSCPPFRASLCLCVSVVRFFGRTGNGAAPVTAAGADVRCHGERGGLAVSGQQRLDDCQVLVRLLGEAMEIVAC